MKFRIEKSFDRDVDRIKEKKGLRKMRTFIATIEHLKKIEGHESFYRIKMGDYRIGIEAISNREVALIRFLHRKDIYRYISKRV